MPAGSYKFTGDGSVVRLFSRNRPSTDALNVLHRWRGMQPGREFETIEDTDKHLVAKLTIVGGDDEAGPQLQALGAQYGVQHEFLPST